MGEILIHVGYPKTATSWFQKDFFPKIKNFDLVDRKLIGDLLIKPFGLNYNKKELLNIINNNYKKNIIISDERLLGGMNSGGYNGFTTKIIANRLKETFPDAKIIIFIRNQFDIIASTYFHYISYGGTYNIKEYLFHHGFFLIEEIGLFSFEFYNYYNIIKLYKSFFNDVDIYLYEEFNLDNIKFLNTFKEFYNYDIDLKKINLTLVNNRIRAGLFHFKKLTNAFTKKQIPYKHYFFNIPYTFEMSNEIISKFNKYNIFGKKITTKKILSQKIEDFIKNKYTESNNKLISNFNLQNIKKHNYPL